ncbi:MAG: hypothetical protein GF350_14550, partial [Chitinivibrionales bacterium]|nr:hypothetical protein [Chitinivibrionales bacterium]
GDEIVQLYISDRAATLSVPIRELEGFERIHCAPGEKRTVTFTVTPYQLTLVDENAVRKLEPGEFRVSVGGGQPLAQWTSSFVESSFTVEASTRIF